MAWVALSSCTRESARLGRDRCQRVAMRMGSCDEVCAAGGQEAVGRSVPACHLHGDMLRMPMCASFWCLT